MLPIWLGSLNKYDHDIKIPNNKTILLYTKGALYGFFEEIMKLILAAYNKHMQGTQTDKLKLLKQISGISQLINYFEKKATNGNADEIIYITIAGNTIVGEIRELIKELNTFSPDMKDIIEKKDRLVKYFWVTIDKDASDKINMLQATYQPSLKQFIDEWDDPYKPGLETILAAYAGNYPEKKVKVKYIQKKPMVEFLLSLLDEIKVRIENGDLDINKLDKIDEELNNPPDTSELSKCIKIVKDELNRFENEPIEDTSRTDQKIHQINVIMKFCPGNIFTAMDNLITTMKKVYRQYKTTRYHLYYEPVTISNKTMYQKNAVLGQAFHKYSFQTFNNEWNNIVKFYSEILKGLTNDNIPKFSSEFYSRHNLIRYFRETVNHIEKKINEYQNLPTGEQPPEQGEYDRLHPTQKPTSDELENIENELNEFAKNKIPVPVAVAGSVDNDLMDIYKREISFIEGDGNAIVGRLNLLIEKIIPSNQIYDFATEKVDKYSFTVKQDNRIQISQNKYTMGWGGFFIMWKGIINSRLNSLSAAFDSNLGERVTRIIIRKDDLIEYLKSVIRHIKTVYIKSPSSVQQPILDTPPDEDILKLDQINEKLDDINSPFENKGAQLDYNKNMCIYTLNFMTAYGDDIVTWINDLIEKIIPEEEIDESIKHQIKYDLVIIQPNKPLPVRVEKKETEMNWKYFLEIWKNTINKISSLLNALNGIFDDDKSIGMTIIEPDNLIDYLKSIINDIRNYKLNHPNLQQPVLETDKFDEIRTSLTQIYDTIQEFKGTSIEDGNDKDKEIDELYFVEDHSQGLITRIGKLIERIKNLGLNYESIPHNLGYKEQTIVDGNITASVDDLRTCVFENFQKDLDNIIASNSNIYLALTEFSSVEDNFYGRYHLGSYLEKVLEDISLSYKRAVPIDKIKLYKQIADISDRITKLEVSKITGNDIEEQTINEIKITSNECPDIFFNINRAINDIQKNDSTYSPDVQVKRVKMTISKRKIIDISAVMHTTHKYTLLNFEEIWNSIDASNTDMLKCLNSEYDDWDGYFYSRDHLVECFRKLEINIKDKYNELFPQTSKKSGEIEVKPPPKLQLPPLTPFTISNEENITVTLTNPLNKPIQQKDELLDLIKTVGDKIRSFREAPLDGTSISQKISEINLINNTCQPIINDIDDLINKIKDRNITYVSRKHKLNKESLTIRNMQIIPTQNLNDPQKYTFDEFHQVWNTIKLDNANALKVLNKYKYGEATFEFCSRDNLVSFFEKIMKDINYAYRKSLNVGVDKLELIKRISNIRDKIKKLGSEIITGSNAEEKMISEINIIFKNCPTIISDIEDIVNEILMADHSYNPLDMYLNFDNIYIYKGKLDNNISGDTTKKRHKSFNIRNFEEMWDDVETINTHVLNSLMWETTCSYKCYIYRRDTLVAFLNDTIQNIITKYHKLYPITLTEEQLGGNGKYNDLKNIIINYYLRLLLILLAKELNKYLTNKLASILRNIPNQTTQIDKTDYLTPLITLIQYKIGSLNNLDMQLLNYLKQLGLNDSTSLAIYLAQKKEDVEQIFSKYTLNYYPLLLNIMRIKKLSAERKFRTDYGIYSDEQIRILLSKQHIW